MRQLTISSFSQARDNKANRFHTDFLELIKEFQNPKIIDEPATEARANQLKPSLPAWSPASYLEDQRSNERVERASCLVFDLDGKDKAGLDPDSIQPKFAYAIHSTTRSGFCQEGSAKLRLVIPLAHDVDAVSYQRLWKVVAQDLGITEHVDSTRLHPGGIFFAPAIFAEHREKYVVRFDVSLPWLDPMPRPAEFELVANAKEKHRALYRAACALAERGLETKEIQEGLIEALRENARRGISKPVEDWTAAELTIASGIHKGKQSRVEYQELTAELEAKRANANAAADATLKAVIKFIKKGEMTPEQGARELAPYKDRIDILGEIEKAWKASDSKLKYPEVEEQVKRGLATQKENSPDEAWRELLMTDGRGNLKANRYNVIIVLKHHPDLKGVGYNVRTQNVGHEKGFPWGDANTLQSHHGQLAALWVASFLGSGENISPELAAKDLCDVARGKQYDPFTVWVEGLNCEPDDSVYRQLCVDCLGAEPTEYHLMVLRSALIMTLKRQFVPGTKADYMPILEGKQGIGKSTFLRQLFPAHLRECYAVLRGDIEDRGNQNLLSMCAVLEVGELDSMRKKETTAFKQWLTIESDRIRPLFSNVVENVPRRAVCWGTTNEEEYLKDTTGNRRFWPIKITKVDFGWLSENREKLWKTVHRDWQAEVPSYPTVEESERLFVPEQEKRREQDILEERVEPYLTEAVNPKLTSGPNAVITLDAGQIDTKGVSLWWRSAQLATLLDLDPNDNAHVRRLGTALRRHGWGSKNLRLKGKQTKVWKKE